MITAPAIVPMVARGLTIGPSTATITVTKQEEDLYVTGSTQVRLDPDVIVVPVNVVYVIPDPRTSTTDADEATNLKNELDQLAAYGISVSVSGSQVVTDGGEQFAQSLFDATSNNFNQNANHPGGFPATERAAFRYHPERWIDQKGRKRLTNIGKWEPPDSLWAQCGIQFRLAKVVRIVDNNKERLYLNHYIEGVGDAPKFCGASNANNARWQDARAIWSSQWCRSGTARG
jgi:hypothetical protein